MSEVKNEKEKRDVRNKGRQTERKASVRKKGCTDERRQHIKTETEEDDAKRKQGDIK